MPGSPETVIGSGSLVALVAARTAAAARLAESGHACRTGWRDGLLSSAPALDTLTKSIPAWRARRRTGVAVKAATRDGREVSLTAHVPDAAQLPRDLPGR